MEVCVRVGFGDLSIKHACNPTASEFWMPGRLLSVYVWYVVQVPKRGSQQPMGEDANPSPTGQ
jgi:hypothetical protein